MKRRKNKRETFTLEETEAILRDLESIKARGLGERERRIEAYFDSLHCVIWPGMKYDLTDGVERAAAVRWLVEVLDKVQSY